MDDKFLIVGLKIKIGNICCLVEASDTDFIKSIKVDYKKFISTSKQDLILFIQTTDPKSNFETLEPIIISQETSFLIQRNDIKCRLDMKTKVAEAEISKFQHSFNSLLRVIFSIVMLEKQGFLLHSAGLVKDNMGYVFAGPEESGKTTIAKSAQCYQILSDDIVGIQRKRGYFYMYATPFYGSMGGHAQNGHAKIKEIFFLAKDKELHKIYLKPSNAVVKLLTNVVFFADDPHLNKQLFSLCCELCQTVKCSEIGVSEAKKLVQC